MEVPLNIIPCSIYFLHFLFYPSHNIRALTGLMTVMSSPFFQLPTIATVVVIKLPFLKSTKLLSIISFNLTLLLVEDNPKLLVELPIISCKYSFNSFCFISIILMTMSYTTIIYYMFIQLRTMSVSVR